MEVRREEQLERKEKKGETKRGKIEKEAGGRWGKIKAEEGGESRGPCDFPNVIGASG